MANVHRVTVMMTIAAAAFLAGSASGNVDSLYVEGRVFCDTCKVRFETSLSEYIPGVKVRLQCRNRTSPGEPLTVTIDSETDHNGIYIIPVDGDHEDEICEVRLTSSPRDDCKTLIEGGKEKARVVLTQNLGMTTTTRHANNLGYMKEEPLPACLDVLVNLGFLPLDEKDEDTNPV